MSKLKIFLSSPRGFCAGVDRAIQIVEQALLKYGAPVYVRHEIVHNKYVVDNLRAKGAVFIEELHEIPEEDVKCPVVFSAHGVPKSVPHEAASRNMFYIDATCPLVSKVHMEAQRHHAQGYHVILIGHAGHPEVFGTMGQLPEGSVTLIETIHDVEGLTFEKEQRLAFVTQTTLSVDDTANIVAKLQEKYPSITGPRKEDICYATTNRQEAVKKIAPLVDIMLVIGAPNSSNSNRLVEVAKNYGCGDSYLVQRAEDINWEWFEDTGGARIKNNLGLTAGASAPEILVEEVLEACKKRYGDDNVALEKVELRQEDVTFKLPRILTA